MSSLEKLDCGETEKLFVRLGAILLLVWLGPLGALGAMTMSAAPRTKTGATETPTHRIRAPGHSSRQAPDPLNAAYGVQDQSITLANGRSEIRLSLDSATKITTAVWGNPVTGDLDGDGDQDAALFLAHDPGGSGIFYYVAVAVNENGRYRGTNAVLLGDRIVPGALTIRDGVVEVGYFDRPADAPMSSRASIEKRSYLTVQGSVLAVVDVDRYDLILVVSPVPGAVIASPLTVKGRARGNWFFEGDFPLRLEDQNGNVISRGYASAQEPWMTREFVPFEGTLEFTAPAEEESGILILQKDNPSEQRELDDEIRIVVYFRTREDSAGTY